MFEKSTLLGLTITAVLGIVALSVWFVTEMTSLKCYSCYGDTAGGMVTPCVSDPSKLTDQNSFVSCDTFCYVKRQEWSKPKGYKGPNLYPAVSINRDCAKANDEKIQDSKLVLTTAGDNITISTCNSRFCNVGDGKEHYATGSAPKVTTSAAGLLGAAVAMAAISARLF